MILASHGIFTTYGFWLPNDPRGSWSDFVRSWELLPFGKATKTSERRSVAHDEHDRERRLAAKEKLKYEPVEFTGEQARAIARGFNRPIDEGDYHLLACSILPGHVHIVSERHSRLVEQIIGHLKTRATQQLVAEGLHPFVQFAKDGRLPSVWAHRAWKVFLDSVEDMERAVEYVQQNPVKEGKRKQQWSFVREFVG